ncbi:MAG: 4Fe-4S dicluster domain-containing protein [Peptococcaceae bacterium]|nr:4Fe-4S dicluster domain-containing protein [Peptococcaceae bacterium]
MEEIWVDREKCLHCLSCVLSCAVAHAEGCGLPEAIGRSPGPKPRLFTVHDADRFFILMCRHCENAPCVEACMAAAITRDVSSGLVNVDTERCVGCWMCVMVCPFEVIGQDKERQVSVKCDRCPGRDRPACVEACPMGALFLRDAGKQSEIIRERYAAQYAGAERGAGR